MAVKVFDARQHRKGKFVIFVENRFFSDCGSIVIVNSMRHVLLYLTKWFRNEASVHDRAGNLVAYIKNGKAVFLCQQLNLSA